MRTIALALIGAGLAAALMTAAPGPAKAENDHTAQPERDRPQYDYWGGRYDGRYRGGYDGEDYVPGYVGGRRWPTWNGCPPHYTVQDGVCKPYRGY